MVRIYKTEIERLYDSIFDFLEIRKISVILIKLFESQAIFYVRLFGTITLDENSQNYPAHIALWLKLNFIFEIQIRFRLVGITLYLEIILQVEIQKAQFWWMRGPNISDYCNWKWNVYMCYQSTVRSSFKFLGSLRLVGNTIVP